MFERTLVAAVLIGLVAPATIQGAQDPDPGFPEHCESRLFDAEATLALEFAPVLRFADNEMDFPTIPFFTAFDGFDNDSSGATDFEDLNEIAPAAPGVEQTSWDHLYEHYRNGLTSSRLRTRHRAVFYRLRCLDARERRLMEQFLRKDAQAWERFGLEEKWPANVAGRDIVVAEYYFYYLNDRGLEGHEEDIEFAFVFFPNDRTAAAELRVVVGAGHAPRIPNNVRLEEEARESTELLIELGGHASIPSDANLTFEFGKDVNWNVADTWGPRDVMAVSGIGFGGGYQAEYTFERSDRSPLFRKTRGNRQVRDCLQNPAVCADYRLLSIRPFERLAQVLAGRDTPAIRQALLDVRNEIWKDSTQSDHPTVIPDSLTSDQIDRLKYWIGPTHIDGSDCDNGSEKHQIWEHRHYRFSPVMIFKDHLYRPSRWSPDLTTWGVSTVPSERMTVHVGFVIPFGYMPVYIPGFLEVQAGVTTVDDGWLVTRPDRWFQSRRRWTPTVSVLYDSEYRDLLGWFARVSWTHAPDRRLGLGRDDWSATAGPSLLLWSWDRRSTNSLGIVFTSIRLRTGVRWFPHRLNDLGGRFSLDLGLSLRQ